MNLSNTVTEETMFLVPLIPKARQTIYIFPQACFRIGPSGLRAPSHVQRQRPHQEWKLVQKPANKIVTTSKTLCSRKCRAGEIQIQPSVQQVHVTISFFANTNVLDCNVLSTHVKQTTKGRNFKIDLSLKRPKEKMISKVMMVSSIWKSTKTKTGGANTIVFGS